PRRLSTSAVAPARAPPDLRVKPRVPPQGDGGPSAARPCPCGTPQRGRERPAAEAATRPVRPIVGPAAARNVAGPATAGVLRRERPAVVSARVYVAALRRVLPEGPGPAGCPARR